jgi:transposase
MRRGFDGLSAMTQEIIQADPFSGHLFVFRNRRGDRVKVLYWDRDGFVMWYKRLERGVFPVPHVTEGTAEMDRRQLMMMLEGLDFRQVRPRKRYRRHG